MIRHALRAPKNRIRGVVIDYFCSILLIPIIGGGVKVNPSDSGFNLASLGYGTGIQSTWYYNKIRPGDVHLVYCTCNTQQHTAVL